MKAELEFLTPTLARQLLEQNPINRVIQPKLVTKYASDMKADRWQNNGETVVISESGNLLDGQHRCRAVLKSGVTIPVFVVRGAPEEAFKTLGQGKSRTTTDMLGIAGYVNTKTVAAIAAFAHFYASGAQLDNRATGSEMLNLVVKHPYITEAAYMVTCSRRFPKSSLGLVALLGNEDRKYDFELAAFIDGVVHGENLAKGDPRHTLREWFFSRSNVKGVRVRAQMVHAATIRAWNAWVEGKTLLVIRVPETFRRSNMDIKGFNHALYADLPDLSEISMAEAANAARSRVRSGGVSPLL